MTIIEATKHCLDHYVNFSGRAPRSEFWKFVLFLLLASIVLTIVNSMVFGGQVQEVLKISMNTAGEQTQQIQRKIVYNGGWLTTIFAVATFLPWLAVTWRRLHDTGRPGWYALAPVVVFPIIAGIIWLNSIEVPINPANLPNVPGLPTSLRVPQSAAVLFACWLAGILSFILVIVWLARSSQPGPNKYGPNPSEVPQ